MSPRGVAIESVSAVFPCYNDAATIAGMVDAARTTIGRLGAVGRIVVVNDGSADASGAVLAELLERVPELHVVTHDQNRGYGGALISGFAEATGEWVFYTDGDAQYDPRELALLAERASDQVDVVQGYKLHRADGVMRTVVGRMYHGLVRQMFGLQIRDTDCDFRLIRRSLLDQIELQQTSGAFCVELVRKLQDAGARFTEVGVHHYERPYGRSQFFRVSAVTGTFVALGRLWWELRRAPVTQPELAPRG